MATLRLILFDKDFTQLDVADLPLGKLTPEVGAGAAVKAVREYIWNNYVEPDFKPILSTRSTLLSNLEKVMSILTSFPVSHGEVSTLVLFPQYLIEAIQAAITEARMVDESAMPGKKKGK